MAPRGGSAVAYANRLVGSLPKVGIRPAIDGRRGSPGIVGKSDDGHGPNGCQTHLRRGPPRQRRPGRMRLGRQLHRRRRRGGPDGGEIRPLRRRRLAGRLALLVLRLGNDGHGPVGAEGRLGIQRHGAARGRLSGRRVGRAHAERAARLRHLRPRRAGRRRFARSPPTSATKILRFVRAGLAAAAMRGKSYLSLGNVSMGIAGSLVNHDFFER